MPAKGRTTATIAEGVEASINDALTRRKDPETPLATALWVAQLKLRSGCKTAYQLEKRFELAGRTPQGNESRKWSKYEVGRHHPGAETVARIEELAPGSSLVIEHPLWPVLRGDLRPARSGVVPLLRSIPPELHHAVFRSGPTVDTSVVERRALTFSMLESIENEPSLDALLVLSVLQREAQQEGRSGDALHIAGSTYRTLLVLCSVAPYRPLSEILFGVFRNRSFESVEHGGARFATEAVNAASSVDLLLQASPSASRGIASSQSLLRQRAEVLRSCLECDLAFALAPPIEARGDGSVDTRLRNEIQCRRLLRDWGLRVLAAGRREGEFPLGMLPAWCWEPNDRLADLFFARIRGRETHDVLMRPAFITEVLLGATAIFGPAEARQWLACSAEQFGGQRPSDLLAHESSRALLAYSLAFLAQHGFYPDLIAAKDSWSAK